MTTHPVAPGAGPRTTPGRIADLALLAVRFEIGTWRSIARWIARRPDVPAGSAAFAYRSPLMPPVLVFLAVSLIEVVALDLLVREWAGLRVALLVLGAWGVVLALGMLAAITVHPHLAGPSGLRVRHGFGVDVHVPWDAVTGARRVRRSLDGRSVQVAGATLHVAVGKETTVEVGLARPVAVTLPRGRTAEITAVHLHADDASALVAAVRARAGAPA